MIWPPRTMTAPTGTSPTSQALCAWSSAWRMANSSAGVKIVVGSVIGPAV